MKLASRSVLGVPEEFSFQRFFETLNRFAEGHLNALLEHLGKETPPPTSYPSMQPNQRKRVGISRVAKQCSWSMIKPDRFTKPGSKLGEVMMAYLSDAESATNPLHAEQLAEHIQQKLGETVARVIEKEFDSANPKTPDFDMS